MKNKRFLSMVLCLVLVASLFTGIVSTASADDVITHVVKNNEYLFKICKSYGLDYYQCKSAIMTLNGYTTETQLNRITVGQQIKLPATNAIAATVTGSSTTTTTVSTTTTVNGVSTTTTSSSTVNGANSKISVSFYLIPHVVKSGETLATICNTYGTTYTQYASMILAVNSLTSANYVWAGRTIYIPSAKAPASGSCYAVVSHTVKSGETLTTICSQYGTSYAANTAMVKGINTGKSLSTIYAGQTILVPVVATVSAGTGTGTGTAVTPTPAQTGCLITFENSIYGNPYALLDGNTVTRADIGKTVTIVPNPKTGYAQANVEVFRADSMADVTVTNNTFLMPACDVVIEVTYGEGKAITKTPALNGTFRTLVNGVDADFAVTNDTVVLAFAPDSGYVCTEAVYILKGTSTEIPITQTADGTWSFVMPEKPVTVEVTFGRVDKSALHTLSYSTTDNSSTGISKPATVAFSVDGSSCKKAAKNAQVTASISLKSQYSIVSVVVNGGAVVVTKVDDTTYMFKMPDADATVEVTVDYTKYYSLKAVSRDGGTIVFTNASGAVIRSARLGDEVHVLAKAKSNYTFASGTFLVTYVYNSAKIETSPVYDSYGNEINNEVMFTMVGADVMADAAWTEDETKAQGAIYFVSCTNGYYDIWVKPSGGALTRTNTALVGEHVQILVDGKNANYICTHLKAYQEVSKTVIFDSDYATTVTDSATSEGVQYSSRNSSEIVAGSFTMPAGENICVEATFQEMGYYVDVKHYSGTGGSVAATYGGQGVWKARMGSTIDLDVSPSTGYAISRLQLYKASTGKTIDLEVVDNHASYTLVKSDYYNVSGDTTYNYLEIIAQFEGSNTQTLSNYGTGYTLNVGTQVEKGTEVVLTADLGKAFTGECDLYYGSTSDGGKTDIDWEISDDNKIITFTMPAGNVYLKAATKDIPVYTTYWKDLSGTSLSYQGVEITGTASKADKDSTVEFGILDTDPEAHKNVSVTYCGSSCDIVSTAINSDGSKVYYFKYTVSTDGGNIDVSTTDIPQYKTYWEVLSGTGLSYQGVNINVNETTDYEGTLVTFGILDTSPSAHASVVAKYSGGNCELIATEEITEGTVYYYQYTVLSDGGNISVSVTYPMFKLTNNGTGYTISPVETSLRDGTEVTLTADSGKVFTNKIELYYVNSDGGKTNIAFEPEDPTGKTEIKFKMPAGDVVLKTTTKDRPYTTYWEVLPEDGSLSYQGININVNETTADPGTVVEFSILDTGSHNSVVATYNAGSCEAVNKPKQTKEGMVYKFKYTVLADGGNIAVSVS